MLNGNESVASGSRIGNTARRLVHVPENRHIPQESTTVTNQQNKPGQPGQPAKGERQQAPGQNKEQQQGSGRQEQGKDKQQKKR